MTTDATITSVLSGQSGAVDMRFRYERQTKAGVVLGDCTEAVQTSGVDLDNTRAVRRSAMLTIDPSQATIDPINECIAITMEVLIDGAYESFPMGLYRITTPEEQFGSNNRRLWSVQAADLNSVLLENSPSAPQNVLASVNYMGAVGSLLTSLGLRFSLPTVTYETPTIFTWPAQTPYLDIINDLLWAINYYPIAPDASGVFTTRERVDPATWTEAIHYQTSQMAVEPFTRKRDRTHYANRVTVKVEDPSRTPAAATWNNNDTNSAISQASTGQIVLQTLSGGRVPEVAADGGVAVAGAIASSELRDLAGREMTATLNTVLDPRRDQQENYRLTIDSIESGSLWRVQGWRTELKTGAVMQHTLQRAIAITVNE